MYCVLFIYLGNVDGSVENVCKSTLLLFQKVEGAGRGGRVGGGVARLDQAHITSKQIYSENSRLTPEIRMLLHKYMSQIHVKLPEQQ